MVKSLPYSQLMRARHITQNEEKWDDTVNQMTNNFCERGYPMPLINKHIDKVKTTIHVESKNMSTKIRRIPFVSEI